VVSKSHVKLPHRIAIFGIFIRKGEME